MNQIIKNTLFTGDNLYVLNGMNSASVDLIYLDPPFNSKRTYSAPVGSKSAGASFKDMWTWQDVDEAYLERMVDDYPYLMQYIEAVGAIHGKAMMAYLAYMTQRMLELHRVLKDTGSLYLHCDPTASHYLKLILDRVFGYNNFRNEIVWCYTGPSNTKKYFPRKHDVILFYVKDKKRGNFYSEQIRMPYKSLNVQHREKMKGGIGGELTPENVEDYKKQGKIPEDYWHEQDGFSPVGRKKNERTGYPTQKPLSLLRRIIKASSERGDIVFDPFAGCATTCVAAQQLERKWIGIDIEKKAAELVVQRLSDDSGLFSDFMHRTDIPKRTDIKIESENSRSVKERLFKVQEGLCNGCDNNYLMKDLEVDHIVPRSKGGGDYYENYQLLCGNCNRIKGDAPMDFFRAKMAKREEHMKRKITFGM